jgi:hypothetical protein
MDRSGNWTLGDFFDKDRIKKPSSMIISRKGSQGQSVLLVHQAIGLPFSNL